MRSQRFILAITAAMSMVVVAGCGGSEPTSTAGSWRVTSLEVDGQPVNLDEPLLMEITADGFSASTPCNSMSGEFGGEIMTTLMACDQARMDQENLMAQAFESVPTEQDGNLVFVNGDVRLVYERNDEPTS